MQTKGVDISEHNGAVDFAALTQAGVKFAILRLGYGSDYTSQDDAQFAQNVRKAEAAGMPWGAYLYSYAKDASMAQSEARHALRLLQGRKPLYGVWYDVEDSQIAVRTWWPPAKPSAPRWRLPGCTRAFTPPSAG